MTISDQNIAIIQEYFKNKPVLKAYLFGSFARGDADVDSDIDILVELDYSERIGLMYFQMQLELQKLLNKEIDLVSEKALSRHIRPIVGKEKQLIYERTAKRSHHHMGYHSG
jgi:predicted nucleotidyltransferase